MNYLEPRSYWVLERPSMLLSIQEGLRTSESSILHQRNSALSISIDRNLKPLIMLSSKLGCLSEHYGRQLDAHDKWEENVKLLDDESYQTREVFAHFGLAMYIAQGLERTLGIALATVYGPGSQKITRSQYDDLLESNFRKTLGRLITHIRETVELSEELERMLSEALEKRNWLAHNYFWDRAKTFMSKEGQHAMIEELKETVYFLTDVDSRFMEIIEQWGEKRGVTKEVLDRMMEELMDAK